MFAGSSKGAAPGWELVQPMPVPRAYHASATLAGRWYIAGGDFVADGGDHFPTQVDVFGPSPADWSHGGELGQGKEYLPAVADLVGNRILLAGGFALGGGGFISLRSCDLVSATGVQAIAPLLNGRYLHAGAFAAGKFIVTGGWGSAKMLDDAEAFAEGTWAPMGVMPAGSRVGHSMTTLVDGTKVLLVGGCQPEYAMKDVDLLDAAQGTWSKVASLTAARCRHQALLLDDGRVLVAGSINLTKVDSSAEIFDPRTGVWSMVSSMGDRRYDHRMALLPDGRVVVVGGTTDAVNGGVGALDTVEIYDPLADTWTPGPRMNAKRIWPALAVLSDGVYVAGGGNGQVLDSVERLAWSDIPPRLSDGGQPDASISDGGSDHERDGVLGDGSSEHLDAAADVLPQDGPSDPPPQDASTDALSRDASMGPSKEGCSCELQSSTDRSVGGSLAVLFVVWTVGRRRTTRMS